MWLVLVVLSLLVLGLLGWRLFRQSRALVREVSATTRRVADTQAEAQGAFDSWRATRLAEDAEYLAAREQDVR